MGTSCGATSACTSTSSGRAPSRAGTTVGEEEGRCVGHTSEAGAAHLEQSELVGGPEAVLERVEQAEGVVPIAVERHHRVDHVLEDARARERSFLGDVPDEQRREGALLGQTDEALGAVANLGDRAGRAGLVEIDDCLDRVDREDVGRDRLDVGEHDGERRVGCEQQPRGERADALGAQSHLLARLLRSDQEAARSRVGEATERLEEQRALPHAGLAAEQRHGAGDKAAAQHPVELPDAGREGSDTQRVDLRDRERSLTLGHDDRRRGTRAGARLDEAPPLVALRAAAEPAG